MLELIAIIIVTLLSFSGWYKTQAILNQQLLARHKEDEDKMNPLSKEKFCFEIDSVVLEWRHRVNANIRTSRMLDRLAACGIVIYLILNLALKLNQ